MEQGGAAACYAVIPVYPCGGDSRDSRPSDCPFEHASTWKVSSFFAYLALQ